MGQIVQKARVLLRARTAAEWTTLNEILRNKELGIESDTGRDKLGDGITPWNFLPYRNAGGGGGGDPTNLSIANRTATTLDIASSTGADATVPAATSTQAGLATAAQIAKLDGIAANATANATDAQLRDRSTHTGTQAADTITGLTAALAGKENTGVAAAAVTAHEAAADPHSQYLTQAEGDGRYRQTATALTDSDIPAGIARDSEVTAAISAHEGAADPHPGYLTAAEGNAAYAALGHVGSGGTAHANAVASGAAGFMTGADKAKLDGVAAGATANATDAQLRDRATHTGTQTASTISDFNSSSRAQTEAALIAGTNVTITPAGSGATRTLTIAAAGGGGATNLSIANRGTTTLDVASDTGTDATIPAATTSLTGLLTSADKTKLDGIATGATANATDAALRDRSTHTGTQAVGTITGLGSLATLSALGNITSAGAIGSTANLPIITTTGGALTAGSFGTTANTFCQGNDSRLSDARTPTAHNQAWSTITATPTTLAGYGITDGATSGAVTGSGLTMATARILGRTTASTGAVEEISIGANLTLSGGVLSASGGGGSLTVQDEGTNLSTSVSTINFTGAGVTATGTSTVTVDIPTGSGGNVSTSGTPSAGQAAEWATGTTIAGVAVTGTGSYVKGTNPALSGATVSNSVTITAGTNAQGQAPLTADFNVITTAAANPSGVTLPAPPASGTRMVGVVNRGVNPVNVYPSTGVTINALAANAAISLPVGATMEFYSETATAWETNTISLSSGVTGILPAGNVATLNQNTTGSAASLTTARTIGGSSFNGTANVTSFPAPGAIGGTTPSTGVFTTLEARSATSLLLGTAGSAVGSVGFRNATSGTITLAPPTGALGTVTLTLPAVTDTVAALAATQTLTNKTLGNLTETVFTVTDGAAVDLDPSNGPIQQWTLGANRTPTATNFTAGESMMLMVNDGTAFAITWTTMAVVWVGGTAPTLATSGWTVLEFWRVGTTTYGARVGDVA